MLFIFLVAWLFLALLDTIGGETRLVKIIVIGAALILIILVHQGVLL